MKLFFKKEPENWILKLYRITDKNSALEFDAESCALLAVELVEKECHLSATDFVINFQNSIHSLSEWKKKVKSQKEIAYSYIGFNSNKTNSFLTLSNPMINCTAKPEFSYIEICIQISSKFADQSTIENISENLIVRYDFEYGYCIKLPSNYNAGNERKIKKNLFSSSVEVSEIDHRWNFHLIGIKSGFIKQLYNINFLNESHFSAPCFKELIKTHGKSTKINGSIQKWTLSSTELESLKHNTHVVEKSIVADGPVFMSSQEAKEFSDKMKPKRPVANRVARPTPKWE
ncbi:MAG: hypothetical protein IPH66_17460 [Crocinitomicaceae bacterium]|nr:hypothetical protein [Crocinitomicaceae bacterium]